MKKAMLIGIVLLLLPGCGSLVAIVDSHAALEKVDQVNVENWQKVLTVRLEFSDKKNADLLADVKGSIADAKTGAEAAKLFDYYLKANAALAAKRAADIKKFGEALDNAMLSAELHARQKEIVSVWRRLFHMIPGAKEIEIIAESKARAYVDKVNETKGIAP